MALADLYQPVYEDYAVFGITSKAVVDIIRPGQLALCFCWKHLKFWEEGSLWSNGACKECCQMKEAWI